MANRNLLRLSATLLFVGELFSLLVGLLHPSRENPNNHTAVFAEYANSADWTAVHLGQFAGIAVIIAGLLVLFFALNVHAGYSVPRASRQAIRFHNSSPISLSLRGASGF